MELATEKEEDEQDERSGWERNSYTLSVLRALEEKRIAAQTALLSRCAQSTDPQVTKLFGEFSMLTATIGLLKPRKRTQ